MKFEELKIERINAEKVSEIVRYGANKEINKDAGCYFGYTQIKTLVIEGHTYLRVYQDIEIDWFEVDFLTWKRFYDEESQMIIDCYSVIKDGKVVYVFSDHND